MKSERQWQTLIGEKSHRSAVCSPIVHEDTTLRRISEGVFYSIYKLEKRQFALPDSVGVRCRIASQCSAGTFSHEQNVLRHKLRMASRHKGSTFLPFDILDPDHVGGELSLVHRHPRSDAPAAETHCVSQSLPESSLSKA